MLSVVFEGSSRELRGYPSPMSRSSEEVSRWLQRVSQAQTQRMTPEDRQRLQQRTELAREREESKRKAKSVRLHCERSRALAVEGLRQMSAAQGSAEYSAVQSRWASAQMASEQRQVSRLQSVSVTALAAAPLEDEDEEEGMAEVAALVGARPSSLEALGGGDTVDAVVDISADLEQLRVEPLAEEECAAKFSLYEGYASQVEKMRSSLFSLHEDCLRTAPASVSAEMARQLGGIDNNEAMGVPDDAREWFVYHMMRIAERNNRSMAVILRDFERKLDFLAKDDQQQCPVCLDDFQPEGPNAAETLSCCHRICKECWQLWSTALAGNAYCPLCRNEEFLGTLLRRASSSASGGSEG
mmetsp:Transcript_69284/g.150810  ORF Transcript_69284/g.150810 Transcript_69284/m.150810 type:complete len:356 (+) Transcript_69284:10-1077(+)